MAIFLSRCQPREPPPGRAQLFGLATSRQRIAAPFTRWSSKQHPPASTGDRTAGTATKNPADRNSNTRGRPELESTQTESECTCDKLLLDLEGRVFCRPLKQKHLSSAVAPLLDKSAESTTAHHPWNNTFPRNTIPEPSWKSRSSPAAARSPTILTSPAE